MAGLFDGTALERPVTCAVCGKPMGQCLCPRDAAGKVCLPGDQEARVWRQKRRDKRVTVVSGLDPQATDLKALARELKSVCSAGGSVVDDQVVIQGDHRDQIVRILLDKGFPAKLAGG